MRKCTECGYKTQGTRRTCSDGCAQDAQRREERNKAIEARQIAEALQVTEQQADEMTRTN